MILIIGSGRNYKMAQTHNTSYIEQPMTVGTRSQGPQKRFRRLRFPSFPASIWEEKNPLLQKGEIGHEVDTGKLKIGDGVTYWNDLPYNIGGLSNVYHDETLSGDGTLLKPLAVKDKVTITIVDWE